MSNYAAPTVVSMAGRRITGALTAGTLIGGRYNVSRLLGRGGFGAVYLATDNRFPARRVAVKEMGDARLSAADRVQAIARFRQEANLLSSLQHPNLPAVSDFLEEGGKAYLVMDFIDGQTLDEAQKAAGGPLEEPLVMGWALQICEVLAYLHRQPQPIIFRDLKPSNAMVTPVGQVKLIDFGIARIFRAGAQADTNMLGSRGYAAPEQYGLEQTDARTDIYALGATLYTLLTNQEPLVSFARKINPQSLPSPRLLNPRISPGVEQVVLTAMQVEMYQRYQSAAEMAQAITNLGFSAASSTGGMRTLAGPDALTFAATQPGSYVSSAPMQVMPTQLGAPPTPTTPQGFASAPSTGAPGNRPPVAAQPMTPLPPSQPGSTPFTPVQSGPWTSGPVEAQNEATWTGTPPAAGGGGPGGGISRRALLIGGGTVAVAAVAGGVYFFTRRSPSVGGGGTVAVSLSYSTEKGAWLQEVINTFNGANQTLNGSNKVIQVELNDLGSVDSVQEILGGKLQPVAWSPASTLEVNRLDYEWRLAHNNISVVSYVDQFQPRSLVRSPLVLASWQQRAQILLQHYRVTTLDWDTLFSAFQVNNWSQIGGQSDWGPVKFGQTLPPQSNSGLLTITLLAYHYYKEQRGLTTTQVNGPACWNYLQVFEDAVNEFGQSSATYLTREVIGNGPPQADVITTYENLALTVQNQAQSQQHQPLLFYYPAVNIVSDHPFVVFQSDWSTDEQKQAAFQVRDFLLETSQQRQALVNGFRPTDPSLSLQDSQVANNPFIKQLALFPNRQPDPLLAQAQPPTGDAVDALINNWNHYNPSPSHTSG